MRRDSTPVSPRATETGEGLNVAPYSRLMPIPIHAPRRQYEQLGDEIRRAVIRVLDSGWYLLGPVTRAFEQAFADYCGTRHCVSVANGTDALEIGLRALDVSAGDEVVTVANAGGYTTTACLAIGAVPVYVDVDPATLTMDLDQAVAAVTGETRCVVATHLYGWAVDVGALRAKLAAAGHREVPIVEDCAQAHGARIGGARVGSIGDLGCFSFYPTKNLPALGDAGAIVTSRDDLAERATRLRQYGWKDKYRPSLSGGRNSRMDEIQAAVLGVYLPHLDRWNESRRRIVARYREATAASETLDMVHPDAGDRFVAHLAVARSTRREQLATWLREGGIDTAVHYPFLDTESVAVQGRPHRIATVEAAAAARDEIISLPCFPALSDEEVALVCDRLRSAP